jgi:RimJ/RimL family protein N-acetyltransferase
VSGPATAFRRPIVKIPFDTARLHIRMMQVADVDSVVRYRNDPIVNELQDWPLPATADRLVERIRTQHDATEVPRDATNLAIVHDGAVIGDLYVGFDGGGAIADIGYTLAATAHRRGFGREAVSALVERLFHETGVHRVHARVSPDHRRSMRLLEDVGFAYEATTKLTFRRRDGSWEDDIHYVVTAADFETWSTRPTGPPVDVELVDITNANASAFARLETHWSQRAFVAPMAASFLDALVGDDIDGHPALPWFRGVVADGLPAGFVMLADVTEHQHDPYLWRLLVDRLHQRRGIGRRVLDQLVEHARSQGAAALFTSWVPDLDGTPKPFYLRYGFVPTGVVFEGEVEARLDLR